MTSSSSSASPQHPVCRDMDLVVRETSEASSAVFSYEYEYESDYSYEDNDNTDRDVSLGAASTDEDDSRINDYAMSNNAAKASAQNEASPGPATDMADTTELTPSAPAYASSSEREFGNFPFDGYRVFDAEAVRRSMDRAGSDLANLLSIPPSAAAPLLRRYKWDDKALIDAYFGDEDATLRRCGVLARCRTAAATAAQDRAVGAAGRLKTPSTASCDICLDDEVDPLDLRGTKCGHGFCSSCWSGYLGEAISGGPARAVDVRCPNPKCEEVVTEEEIEDAFSDADVPGASDILATFRRYQLMSFVDNNRLMRWCPSPHCDRVVSVASSSGLLVGEGTCQCGTRFCLKCGEGPHEPAPCDLLVRWTETCSDNSHTTDWILTHTRACPKCRKRIEKDGGCSHMTCSQCRFEFCWLCMQDWSAHGYNSTCNRFSGKAADGDDASRAEKAARELDRYLHYFKRFQAHSKGQEFAETELGKLKATRAESEMDPGSETSSIDWEVLQNVLIEVVKCRRVLKYTYVVGFFMKEHPQLALYEDHQELLERFTEQLSEQSEKPHKEIDFKAVFNMTRVVDGYAENIMKYEPGDIS